MKLKLRKPSWTEKRDSIRLDLECPIVYRILESKWLIMKKVGKPVPAILLKPSTKGLRISGEFGLPVGTLLKIEVQLKKLGMNRSYFLRGQVVWSEFSGKTKSHEQGVALQNNGEDQGKWEKFILEHLREQDNSPREQTFNN